MTGYQFWTLVKHDLSFRRPRHDDHGSDRRRWSFTIPSLVVWFAVVTWQGPHIHFNLNYAWYATLALPLIARSVAYSQISREYKNGTIGWWLALPVPRFQLLWAKWFASMGTMVRRLDYLAMIAVLGIYTMMLNGTMSSTTLSNFLLTGLAWTTVMACLIPPMAALGVLMAVLTYSRWKDLTPALWLLLAAGIWLAVAQARWYLTISHSLMVTVKTTFVLVVAATWILGAIRLWLATRILDRSTTM